MEINERLQYFLEVNQLTSSDFADKIGVQRSGMSHLLSGRNKPSFDFIQKFKTAFPDLDLNWFITGSKKKLTTQEVQKDMAEENTETTSDDEDYTKQKKKEVEEIHSSPTRLLLLYPNGSFEEFQPKVLR